MLRSQKSQLMSKQRTLLLFPKHAAFVRACLLACPCVCVRAGSGWRGAAGPSRGKAVSVQPVQPEQAFVPVQPGAVHFATRESQSVSRFPAA